MRGAAARRNFPNNIICGAEGILNEILAMPSSILNEMLAVSRSIRTERVCSAVCGAVQRKRAGELFCSAYKYSGKYVFR